MRYRYKARSMDGKVHRGVIEASDSRALITYLDSIGLFCCSWKACEEAVSRHASIKSKHLSPLCRQMSVMLSAGVPIFHILDICCANAGDRQLKEALAEIREGIQKGLTFSEAMETISGSFPNLLVHMVKTGESSGRLDELLDKMADYYSREEELNGKVREAMTYPLILLSVTIAVSFFLLTTVLPQFQNMLEGQPIPWFTRLMLDAGSNLCAYGFLYIIIIFLLTALSMGVLTIPSVRLKSDRTILYIPIIGKLIKTIYTSRFANAFAVLYGGGTGVLEALDVAGRMMDNTFVRKCLKEAAEGLKRGETLSQALKASGIFHPVFVAMTASGEESGSLERVLKEAGVHYEKEAERAIEQMIALLEPGMILIMALIVGSMVLAVTIPVFTMYSSML